MKIQTNLFFITYHLSPYRWHDVPVGLELQLLLMNNSLHRSPAAAADKTVTVVGVAHQHYALAYDVSA